MNFIFFVSRCWQVLSLMDSLPEIDPALGDPVLAITANLLTTPESPP